MGGGLLLGNLSWASTMLAYNARPPDPLIVGERWREMWLRAARRQPALHPRLDGPSPARRLLAPRLGGRGLRAPSRRRSTPSAAGPTPTPIACCACWPSLKAPVKALIGPWAHAYPHNARPGPQIGFLQECLRWWDRWLKGIDNGIMEEPRLHAWIQDSRAAGLRLRRRGRAAGSPRPRWPPRVDAHRSPSSRRRPADRCAPRPRRRS